MCKGCQLCLDFNSGCTKNKVQELIFDPKLLEKIQLIKKQIEDATAIN